MKRLAFLGVTIATLIASIQVQAQQYDPVANCVRFPQNPNPEAELRFLISNPNIRVCPSPHDLGGEQRTMEPSFQRSMTTLPMDRGWQPGR